MAATHRARVSVLPPLVAERIAAGEVIERPSSVVKELVENALDAGATEIAVVLEDGGRSLIEVLDNGHGMDREDLALSVLRHATSKLREVEDLDRIRTLGFRGEALPSIAAVSELSIVSRAKDAERAHELRMEDQAAQVEPVTFGHFLGSANGTRIRARGLFSQMPARLKFLKSQAAEVGHVREWIERLALAHPAAGFRLVSDDRTILSLRPQEEAARVRAVLADGNDFPVVTAEAGGFRVHWLQGLSTPQKRKLVQVVNGRAVRDRLLQQALLGPFRQALLPGQFPAVALFAELDPATIDVNVHPTKTELRFLESGKVFRAVQSLIEELIGRHGAPAYAGGAAASAPYPVAVQPSFQPAFGNPAAWPAREPSWTSAPAPRSGSATAPETRSETGDLPAGHPFTASRFKGIAFATYLMFDLGDELGLVDQHAAHERVRYEKLKKRSLGGAQALLIPEVVHFPAEERPLVESRLAWLGRLGFEAELFGETSAVFRSVPSEWGTDQLRVRLKNLLDRLLAPETQGALALDETLFEALASEACHSSVRAGDRLEPAEALALVDQLFACSHPWNCPHGRPTVARIPRARFEEWFQRRV
jgi:DNA mismatch repair protein MutL